MVRRQRKRHGQIGVLLLLARDVALQVVDEVDVLPECVVGVGTVEGAPRARHSLRRDEDEPQGGGFG